MAAPLKRIDRETERAGPAPPNVPLFHSLLERMRAGGRWVVLDLGPAQPVTIRVLGQFRCRLEIAHLGDGLGELAGESDTDGLRAKADTLLPARRDEPTDIVLCWDLLNYLERPALRAIAAAIAARARPGTLMHALIAYSAAHIPLLPNRYAPIDDHHLDVVATTAEQRASPRYTPEDLTLAMPDFHLERAMLLRNGMQEFLFRIGPDEASQKWSKKKFRNRHELID